MFLFPLLLLVGLVPVHADLTMPMIFGDHMVLQQESKLPVWGWADPGEGITVKLGDQSATAQAGADRKWRVDLPPVPPGTAPMEMTITGKNTLKFTDVIVGDVWMVSGQSNMEIPLIKEYDADTVLPKAGDPQLRFFTSNRKLALEPFDGVGKPEPTLRGQWNVCTPETAQNCSAVGYFFARDLRLALHRPIGLVISTAYSTAAEAWTSVPAIQKNVDKDPLFKDWIDAHEKQMADHPARLEAWNKVYAQYEADLKNWNEVLEPQFKEAQKAWRDAAKIARDAGKPEPAQPQLGPKPQPPMPVDVGGIQIVGNCFNGTIAPWIPYAIKGVIWYQGNGNAGRAEQYKTLFPLMIADWREQWGEGNFPFLFVQLENFGKVVPDPCPSKDTWPLLREAQDYVHTVTPNTGLVTAIDVGDPNNLHPRDKMDVGARLALVARNKVYGQNVICAGPSYDKMKIEGNKIRVTFKDVGGGLIINAPPWIPPGQTAVPTNELIGFAIAGAGQKWVWAKAQIEGNDVLVSADLVSSPVAVRYGWENSPPGLNLYNKELLPAFPFRTDHWDP